MELNLTEDGFLANLNDWTPEIASKLAMIENIQLTDAHWEIINLMREFYQQYQASPSMRTLVNLMQKSYGSDKGNSIYIQTLFPNGATIQANKIAGLPKPIRCI